MPRQWTAEEISEMFLAHCKTLVNYWATVPNKTDKEKLDGLMFSLLAVFDGSSAELPSFELIPAPHEDDKEYNKTNGNNWWPPLPKEFENNQEFVSLHQGCISLHETWAMRKGKNNGNN